MARLANQDAPQPIARRTRSASAEPMNARMAAGQGSTSNSTRQTRRTAQQTPLPQLDPLSEDEDEVEIIDAQHLHDDEEIDGRDVDLIEDGEVASHSPGAAEESPTHSQVEAESLDPEAMEDSIGDLNAQAGNLLRQFKHDSGHPDALQSIITELRDTISERRLKANKCWDNLSRTQANFAANSTYLKPHIILRKLLRLKATRATPKSARSWRPDDLICKANLAILAYGLLTIEVRTGLHAQLEALDLIFPSPFLLGFDGSGGRRQAGHSALVSRTFDFALELRTFLILENIQQEKVHDVRSAASMIQHTMLRVEDDEETDLITLQEALRTNVHAKGWDLLPEPQDHESGIYADSIIERTQELVDLLFEGGNVPASNASTISRNGLDRLREKYSLERFQIHLLEWVNVRLKEIEGNVRRAGGIDEILNSLEQKIQQRRINPDAHDDESDEEGLPRISNLSAVTDDLPAAAPVPSSSRTAARPSTFFRGRPPRSSTASRLLPSNQARDEEITVPNAEEADMDSDIPSPALIQARDRLRVANEQHQQQNRRSLLDEQPNGVRLEFDDSGPSQSSAAQRRFQLPRVSREEAASRLTHRQRSSPPLEADDINPTADEGFQEDTRDIPVNRTHPRLSTAQSQNASPEGASPRRRRRSSDAESPAKRARRNPGQAIEPFQATGHDLADEAAQASLLAKLSSKRALPKPQRGRVPWAAEETEALLEYVGEYGGEGSIPYAYIKSADNQGNRLLLDRSAEDLRFKARILKMAYLRSGMNMPPNLKHVALPKKDIDRLAREGIEYEQVPLRARARDSSP